jgi:ribose-phosphate pyrophosphokinase
MKITKYPDGSSYVNGTKLGDSVFRVNSYEDLHHLEQFVDAFHSANRIRRPTITIPNLIDAQADKRFNIGESSGLKIVLKRLASIPAYFKIFHPHNEEVVSMGMELLGNPVTIINNDYFVEKVLNTMSGNGLVKDMKENLILMSSDSGGFKPLMKLCDIISWRGETESASKSRSYLEGVSKLVQKIDRQDFGGKDVLIVDDICVNGGTFIGLAKMLRERNVGNLYLAVSHITLENLNPVLMESFDEVFTTNSKGYTYTIPVKQGGVIYGKVPSNLTVINLF